MGKRKRIRKIKSGNKRVREALMKQKLVYDCLLTASEAIHKTQIELIIRQRDHKEFSEGGEVVTPANGYKLSDLSAGARSES